MPDKIEKLKELMKIANDGLSKSDFISAFKEVLDFLKKVKHENATEMERIEKHLTEMTEEMKGKSETEMEEMKKKMMSYCEAEMKDMYQEHEDMMAKMDKKISEVHDGKDADEEMMITRVLTKIPKPLELDNAYAIRNKLEKLEGKEKLRISAIAELEDILEELKKQKPRVFGGGGFSKIALDSHIVDPYTPTGTINGVNTDFTLNHTPSPATSLKLYRGGQLQSLTEDFTLSGNTITFLIAPVAGEILKVEHRI